MLIEMLFPPMRSTIRRDGMWLLAVLGCTIAILCTSRVEAWQSATDAPPTEGRSRLSTPPTDARRDASRTTSAPGSAPAMAPYADPWRDIRYEDLALLVKAARRSLKAKLTADAEIAPGYVPPALKDKDGIIVLRLRSGGVLLVEAESSRMPVVEAASAAGLSLAQTIARKNLPCDSGGDQFGMELEWLGQFEPVGPNFTHEGHWTDELLHSFEPAVEGIAVEFQGKQAWTCPSEIVTRNYSPDLAIAAAESRVGVQFIHKVRLKREIRYYRFPALHLWQASAYELPVRLHRGEQLVEAGAIRARGLDAVNARQLDEAIARMRKYLRYLQMSDGGFAEEFGPSADQFEHGPTLRMQMHALSSLVTLCKWTDQAADLERLKKCLDRAKTAARPLHRATKDDKGRVKVEEAGLAVQIPGESECLEATARLLLAMLALERLEPLEPLNPSNPSNPLKPSAPSIREDPIAKGLVKAILAGHSEDGRLELQLNSNNANPGAADTPEAVTAGIWGMRALHAWDESGRDEAISLALGRARLHYQAWYEREAEPQAAAALARALMQLYDRTNDARCSDQAFAILDRFAALQVTPASCPMPELWGAINAGQPGVVGSDSAACVSALAEGLELARRIGDGQRVERYEHAVRLGARFILQLEFTVAGCFYVRTPRDALGGVRMSPWNNRIRVDRCGDALEALIRTRTALYGAPVRRSKKQP